MSNIVHLTLPDGAAAPDCLSQFTPEDNLLLLQVGGKALMHAKHSVAASDHQEWQKRSDQSWQHKLSALQQQIDSEKRASETAEVSLRRFYEVQVEQWQRKWETAMQEVCRQQQDVLVVVEAEARRVAEKCRAERDSLVKEKDQLYVEKEKQVERLTHAYEQLLVHQSASKSNATKGTEGEQQFADMARTFMDFKGFELHDKHTQGGEGDFHLHFDEFDVLVDAKNYKKKVPVDQREKIRKDLAKHPHISFAWLVSLNTHIEKYDRAPVMYEWINPRQCIVYINHLRQFDQPALLLRMVWFTCRELVKLVQPDSEKAEDEHGTNWREQHFQTMDKIKALRKIIREVNASLNHSKNLVQTMDDQLRGMLDQETSNLVDSHVALFDAWWTSSVTLDPSAPPLLSTDAWFHFREQHRSLLKSMDITIDKFRAFVKAKVPVSHLLLKSKHPNSAFELLGMRLTNESASTDCAAATEPAASTVGRLDHVDLVHIPPIAPIFTSKKQRMH